VEIDVGRMNSEELAYAARFAARLALYWPEGHHEPTRDLFTELAQGLTDCHVDLELRIAAMEVRQADTWGMRVQLGMADPDDPPPVGWIGRDPGGPPPVSDVPPEPEGPQASEPDEAEPGTVCAPEPES
jgi:hypothetical protein